MHPRENFPHTLKRPLPYTLSHNERLALAALMARLAASVRRLTGQLTHGLNHGTHRPGEPITHQAE